MKMTIGIKIGFAFFVLLLLFGIVGTNIYYNVNEGMHTLDKIKKEAQLQIKIGNLRFGVTQIVMASNDYIITNKEYYKHEYEKNNVLLEQNYHHFINSELTDKEKQLTYEIKKDIDSIRSYSERIFRIANPHQSSKAWALMEKMDYTFGSSINTRTTQIFDGVTKRIEENRKDANQIQANITTIVFRTIIISFIFSLIIIFLSISKITKPIKLITKVSDSIANGDYSHRVVVKTNDEIALLAKSFNKMAESILQSLKTLEESKRLTESIVASVPVGLLVFDENGKILNVNKGFCDLFGLDRNILVGQNIEPMFEKLNAPEECRNYVLSRTPISDIECNYSDAIKGLRIISLTLNPIQLSKTESLLILEDITKRKHDEQIVINSEKHFRALIENSTDGLCVISPDGHLLYESLSNNSITGYEHNELLNKNILPLFHSDDLPAINDLLMSLLEQPWTTVSTELRFLHKDGRWLWIEAKWKNAFSEPAIGGIVVNCRDITERIRGEEVLQQREEQYRIITESVNDAIIAIDQESRIIFFANNSVEKMFGYSPPELLGKEITALMPDRFHDRHRSAVKSYAETGVKHVNWKSTEFPGLHKSGKEIHLEISYGEYTKGSKRYFIGVLRDISERKRAEAALHDSREDLYRLLNSIAEGAYGVDTDGNCTFVNRAFLQILGYQNEHEVLGKHIHELTHHSHYDGSPYPSSECRMYRAIKANQPINVSDEVFWRKDGVAIPVEYWSHPIVKDGVVIGAIATFIDITDRKRAEEEIISQKNRFAQLFENSPVAIALLDDKDKVVVINESFSALFGYYLEEIRGQSLEDLIVPPELKEEAKSYSDQTREGNQINKESYRKKKDGTLVYVQIVGIPVIVNDKTVGIYGMYMDLTQRKDAEEKMKIAKELAEQSDRLKSEFLAQMSHEVRTPLNAVLNYSNLIKSEFEDKLTEDYLEIFEGLNHEGKRITRTIDSILNLSQLHTGTFVHQITSVNLGSNTLPNLIKEYSLVAKAKNLDLRFRNLTEDSTISADQYCIEQIFSNLIDNAIKFNDKGFVEIRVLKDASNVIVEVEDSGIGISNDFIPQLFEPFRQEEHGYSRKYEGNGLGLALTKKYCEINNAVIEVESKKNVGSTFKVKFNERVV